MHPVGPRSRATPGSKGSTAACDRRTSALAVELTGGPLGGWPVVVTSLCRVESVLAVCEVHVYTHVSPGLRMSGVLSPLLVTNAGGVASQRGSLRVTLLRGWSPGLVTVSVNVTFDPAAAVAGPVLTTWMAGLGGGGGGGLQLDWQPGGGGGDALMI